MIESEEKEYIDYIPDYVRSNLGYPKFAEKHGLNTRKFVEFASYLKLRQVKLNWRKFNDPKTS